MCLWKLQSTTYIWIEPFCGWNKWWCLVDLQPLYPHQSKTMYNVTLISHTHAATIPSPIKKTSCPPFPPEDQNYKQECLPLHNPSPHLSFCPMVFSWAPSNYLFKRHTKGRIITIPKYCLVLELALGLLPPYFHLSYLLYTSISTSLSHHLSFFFFFSPFHIRVLQMCVCGLGNICFYSKPPVQFDSNQPPSVMFAWHAWWKIENTQTS